MSEPAGPSPEDVVRARQAEAAGLRPAPPALEVDTFTIVLIGTVLWALAFLALLPFRDGRGLWVQTCAAGVGLGLLGLFLSRNRRVRKRRPPR